MSPEAGPARLPPQKGVKRFLLAPDEAQKAWLGGFVRDNQYLTNHVLRLVNRKFRRSLSAYFMGQEFRHDLDESLGRSRILALTDLAKSGYLESVMEKAAAMYKEPVMKRPVAHVREGLGRIVEREPGRFVLSLVHPTEHGMRVEIPIHAGSGEARREPELARLMQDQDLKAFEIIRTFERHGGVRFYFHATFTETREAAPHRNRVMGVWMGESRFLEMAVVTEADGGDLRVVGPVLSTPAGPLRNLKVKAFRARKLSHRKGELSGRVKGTVRGVLGLEAQRIAVRASMDGCAFVVMPDFDLMSARTKTRPGAGPERERIANRALSSFEYGVFGQAIERACFGYGIPVRRLSPAGMRTTCTRCHSEGKDEGSVFLCARCGAQRDPMFVGAYNLALAVHGDLRKMDSGKVGSDAGIPDSVHPPKASADPGPITP